MDLRARWKRKLLLIATLSIVTWQAFQISRALISRNERSQKPSGELLRQKRLSPQNISVGPFPVKYTFDNPSNYSGPVVKGWPPERSRQLSDYIRPDEDTILTNLTCLNLTDTKVLIVIQSNPIMVDRRTSDRSTWMTLQSKFPHVRTVFLFGTQDPSDPSPFVPIEPERNKYCDVVQMDYVDHYENVTLDTVSALKFVSRFDWPGGNRPDFVVIGDDDTYVNIPMLWAMLYEEKRISKSSSFLLGHKFITPEVMSPTAEDNDKQFVDRVISPKYMYNLRFYPDSLSGSCFVLPIRALDCLYSASLALPLFHINDIHVTGFAAESCGFSRENDLRFHPGKAELKDLRYQDISFHWSDAKRKILLHHILTKQDGDLTLKMEGRYYLEGGNTLRYCTTNVECMDVED